MAPLTPRGARETTRKPGTLLSALVSVAILAGCAAPGPNHVYLTTIAGAAVHDLGPPPTSIDRALQPGEHALGLAYDFNTDHLFIRVAPTGVIRVIERPSGKILRDMPLTADLRTEKPADLAIRSRDRHLFAVHPDGHSIVELTLFGDFVRKIDLMGLDGAVGGLAYDQKKQQLLILTAHSPARLGSVDPAGHVTYYVTFAEGVTPVSLGYDSDAERFFVPLSDPRLLGEFDTVGKLIVTHRLDEAITAIDAGARSFVRVF